MKKYFIILVALCGCGTHKIPYHFYPQSFTNPSFDCYGADLTIAEEFVCNNEYIARMDREISQMYDGVLNKYKNQQSRQNDIKSAQRDWIANMRKMMDKESVGTAYRMRHNELNTELGQYVFVTYSASPVQILAADEDSILLPHGREYFVAQYDYIDCLARRDEMRTSDNPPKDYTYHCVPYDFWETLSNDADNTSLTKQFDEYKNKIMKCSDFDSGALFVCQSQGAR